MVFPELGNTCQGHTALQRLLQSLRLVLSSENIKCLCVVGFPVKILRRIGGLDLKYIVWAMPASPRLGFCIMLLLNSILEI